MVPLIVNDKEMAFRPRCKALALRLRLRIPWPAISPPAG